jgi:dienelactone hydrolase
MIKNFTRFALAAGLLSLGIAAGPAIAQTDKAGQFAGYAEKYWKLDSGQKVELGEVVHAGKPLQLVGWLTKPSDAPKQAAVIYLGGCNGFDSLGKQYMAEHLTWLREEGYVVLNVDGLTPRGITREGGYCDERWSDDNPRYISGNRRAQDAMIALTWLAKQPYVDPNRIGLFGFSGGANSAFAVAVHYAESYEPPRANAWGAYDARFKAIFAIYPRCFDKADYSRTKIRTNTMIVIGELDTSSKPEWCKPFKAVEGVEYRLKLYPGVYHSYMQPLRPREVVWSDGSRHWFAPDPAAKADTVKEMKAWFAKNL